MIVIKPIKWYLGNQCLLGSTFNTHHYVARPLQDGRWKLERGLTPGFKEFHSSLGDALKEAESDLTAAITKLLA